MNTKELYDEQYHIISYIRLHTILLQLVYDNYRQLLISTILVNGGYYEALAFSYLMISTTPLI